MKKLGVALTALFLLVPLGGSAHAFERAYWVNFGAEKISYSTLHEGPGADLPIPPALVSGPWGLAIDSAAGKIYWANANNDTIGYANLDGSEAALLNTSGATINGPNGLTLDVAAGRLYWANYSADKISYASLNGSGGADLDTTGATVDKPSGVVVDPAGGRVYWTSYQGDKISYASLNGSGGADLDTTGAPVDGPEGIVLDYASGRAYWGNWDSSSIGYASLSGGGGGQFNPGFALFEPVGLAISPFSSALFWAEYGESKIRFAGLSAPFGGQIQPYGATQQNVAWPVLQVRPYMLNFPVAQGGKRPGSVLSCSQGEWRNDQPQAFLFWAPQSFSYQWLRNDKAIEGATGTTIQADKVGNYHCEVTAANAAGRDTEPSNKIAVAAEIRLKKAKLNRRNGTATLRLQLTGSGPLVLTGKGVARQRKGKAKGTAILTVRSKGKAKKALNATGKARVKAKIAYTPAGGKALKLTKAIVLKKRLD